MWMVRHMADKDPKFALYELYLGTAEKVSDRHAQARVRATIRSYAVNASDAGGLCHPLLIPRGDFNSGAGRLRCFQTNPGGKWKPISRAPG